MMVMLRMTVASVCALTSILSVSLGGVAGHTSAAIGMRRTLLDDDGLVLDSDVGKLSLKLSLDFVRDDDLFNGRLPDVCREEAVSNIKMCFEEKVETLKESVEIELEEEKEACEIQLQEQLEELNDEEEDDEEAEEEEEEEDDDDDDEVRSSKKFKKLKEHISKHRGRGKHRKHGRRGLLFWRGKSAKKSKKSAKKPKKSKQSIRGAYAARKQLEKIREKARGVANAYGLMKMCIKSAQQTAFAKTREGLQMLKQDTECLDNEREDAKQCAIDEICADGNVEMAEQSFNKANIMIATMSKAINECSSVDITAAYECVKGMIGDLKPSAIQESLKAVKEVSICPIKPTETPSPTDTPNETAEAQTFQTLEFEPVEVVDGDTEAANPPEPPQSETEETAEELDGYE